MILEVDGRRVWAYSRGTGAPDSPTVVLLHGVGADHSIFQPQSGYLASRGFATLAPDLPGHGRSDGPPLASVGTAADWLEKLLSVCDVARVDLVGHSFGSLVMLEFAVVRSGVVRKLALLGSADRLRVHPELLSAAREDGELTKSLMTAWSFPKASVGVADGPGLSVRGAVRSLLDHTELSSIAAGLTACEGYDASPAARQVQVPTLVISGTDDRMAPAAAARALAGLLEDVRLESLAGVGHYAMLERPRQISRLLRAFLSGRR